MNYSTRKDLLQKWETARSCTALLYVTGDRPGLETQVHPEVLDFFAQHLDGIGTVKTVSLFLHTRGGSTLAAWSLVNLIRPVHRAPRNCRAGQGPQRRNLDVPWRGFDHADEASDARSD